MSELRRLRRKAVKSELMAAMASGKADEALIDRLILKGWPRGEKIANKDVKLRTFISQEDSRKQLSSHVYDITYGQVSPEDALVCIDDSIVRGNTLANSILRILAQVNPRMIVIASTAPQIRYPDCYGIDMSQLGKFIAFQAAVALCKETGQQALLEEVYRDCVAQAEQKPGVWVNHVKRIYEPFCLEALNQKIAELVRPKDLKWQGEVQILFQRIEALHKAVPSQTGDWYFTGNYPTQGGYHVVNQAYINYFNKNEQRSY